MARSKTGSPASNSYFAYLSYIKACSWDDVPAEISPADWSVLATLYNHPDDIDLFMAGIAERPAFGEQNAVE